MGDLKFDNTDAKDQSKAKASATPATETKPVVNEPNEMVIREIMVQKQCSREKAIEILKNPTPHK